MVHRRLNAFSLVEVTMAIGILSFCVLAVVGLLPAGLKSVQSANEQAAAAQIVADLSNSLRSARMENGNATFTFANSTVSFGIAGNSTVTGWTNLNLEGLPGTSTVDQRLSARLLLYPPATPASTANATISVAWPAAASPVWNSSNRSWSKADGSVTTTIIFIPNR